MFIASYSPSPPKLTHVFVRGGEARNLPPGARKKKEKEGGEQGETNERATINNGSF